MNKIKHLMSFVLLSLFCLLFYASKTQKHLVVAHEDIKKPNYDYVPVETNIKTGIAIALVNPIFARDMKYSNNRLFADFSKHMATDYEEMLTKRGYTLRGPFQSVDDMVYNDKVACPLFLQPEIEINFDCSQIFVKPYNQTYFNGIDKPSTQETFYLFSGTLMIDGHINMVFSEPFTKEKIKVLSISIPQKSVLIHDVHAYKTNDFIATISISEEGELMNPIYAALEDIYQSSFKTAYNHLDPHEINDYAGDSKRIREKSNFMSK